MRTLLFISDLKIQIQALLDLLLAVKNIGYVEGRNLKYKLLQNERVWIGVDLKFCLDYSYHQCKKL